MKNRYYSKFLIKENKKIFFLEVDCIDWVESDSGRTLLHVNNRVHTVRESLDGLENKLNPFQFIRIHDSYIVNIDRIRYIEQWFKGDYEVVLEDDTRLKMNRSYKNTLETFH